MGLKQWGNRIPEQDFIHRTENSSSLNHFVLKR